ncbi:Extracellular matrix-binding ebh [Babesia ovata]|uniref:Extracellular matrix-binding ebh n=1 Tax=Babesia ovata TaxID=189622 RepID=A0A2H6K6E3_9APIC|nr:Extracellular matrix-binding ebh [Babesia ovata]GBE58551.1 Extracellular matrix-binding ebh [Babesia ovata]
MASHGVPLNTLKQCLEFLEWLKNNDGKQQEVARELATRYGISNNRILFTGQLPPAVSEFLGHVSTFYTRLCHKPDPGSYTAINADQIVHALLDCIPKFLAALYFLWYNVDYRFDAVGGAKWRDDNPGWELDRRTWYGKYWGGELQNYLRMLLSVKYGGLIAGGFSENEVTYGYEYDSIYGYWYGESMVDDLQKILNQTLHNDFRDVFFTTVISKSGTQISNTANVLALVRTFCQIVISVKNSDVGKLTKALERELKDKCINWPNLVAHCKTLEQQLGKIFKKEGFSHTGQARRVDELNTERFAGETAKWFRQHLHDVQQNVKHINKGFPVDDTLHLTALQPFATKNIFPYGFIFGDQGYGTMGDAWKKLSDHWRNVIDMLGRYDDGLAKLKRLLDGERCPPPQKPRSRPPPALRRAMPAPAPGTSRIQTGRTTGPRGSGGWLSRGSQGSGVRGGGWHNHRSSIQGRGGGQNRGRGPGPPRGRAQGPGAHGAKGVQRSRHTGHRASTEPQLLHRQSTSQSHPQQPSHSAPRVPIPLAEILPTPPHSVSQTSVRGPSSASSSSSSSSSVNDAGGMGLGTQAAAYGHSQQSGKNLAPNQDIGQVSRSDPSSDLGAGERAGLGGVPSGGGNLTVDSMDGVSKAAEPVVPLSVNLPQTPSDPGSPGPSQDGAPGKVGTLVDQVPDSDSMVSSGIHPVVSSTATHTQATNVQAPDSLSSVVPPPGGDQGRDRQTLSSNPTQQNSHLSSDVRSTHQGTPGADSRSPAVSSAGPGGNDASGGGGGSAGATDGDSQVDNHSGKPPNTSQPSLQHQTPGHSAPGSPSSDIPGSKGGVTPDQKPATPQVTVLTQPPSGPGSGTGPNVGQGAGTHGSQQVTQRTSQGTGQSTSSGATPSGAPAPGSGGSGKAASVVKQTCSDDQLPAIDLSGKDICRPKSTTYHRKSLSPDLLKKLSDIVPQNQYTQAPKKSKPVQTQIPPPLSSQPSPPQSEHQPTGGRPRPGKTYYVPGERRTRQGDTDLTAMQPDEFTGEVIKYTATRTPQEKVGRKIRAQQQAIRWNVEAENARLKENQDRLNAEQQKKAEQEWEKQKQRGKATKRYDDDVVRIKNILQKSRDEEAERKKLHDWAGEALDGFQPADQYPQSTNYYPRYSSDLYALNGGAMPDPHEQQNEREREELDKLISESDELRKQAEAKYAADQAIGREFYEQDLLEDVHEELVDIPPQPKVDGHAILRDTTDQKYDVPLIIDAGPAGILIQRENMRPLPEGVKPGDDLENKLETEIELKALRENVPHTTVLKHNTSGITGDTTENSDSKRAKLLQGMLLVSGNRLKQPDVDVVNAHRSTFDPNFVTNPLPPEPNVKVPKKPNRQSTKSHISPMQMFTDSPRPIPLPEPPKRLLPPVPFLEFPAPPLTPVEIEAPPGVMINEPICPANYPSATTEKLPPTDASKPPPRTVRDMLCWLGDLPNSLGYAALTKHLESLFDNTMIIASSESFSNANVIGALADTCGHASTVLAGIHGPKPPDLSQFHYQRYSISLMYYATDPYILLCQLLSYVYASYHQLSFLRTMCWRDSDRGGWCDCQFGRDVEISQAWKCLKNPVDPLKLQGHDCDASPLQGFLTDQSDLSTYWYQRGDICRRSRVRMGFRPDHLRQESKHGFYIYQILKGLCYNNADPLEKLCTYLNCLARRTPRTTGELVSFFHNFGNALHKSPSQLSPLGSALSTPHENCPDWDCLKAADLRVVQGIRGSATPNSNHDKDQEHPNTLSTLLSCGITNANCQQLMTPITYRAYALYSPSFAHHYLSWTTYLPDRLWESLYRLRYDLKRHRFAKCPSLNACPDALPLLYRHGFTPPDRVTQSSLTCSEVIAKLREVVAGKPIADLMTAMDTFLYGIRRPFFYTVFTLWLIATLYILIVLLYRMDVLHIRSHLLTTKASHLIDVKALLAGSRRMLSLYKDNLLKVSKSLEQYITDLDKWIDKTTKDIVAAQKLVQKILDEVNGNVKDKHLNHKNNLDEAIEKVQKQLQERADDLTQWKEAAEKVLQGTITSSTSVHTALDHSKKDGGDATNIGKGIQTIETAKGKVESVNTGLQQVHKDLQTWNSAASGVLNNVVSKAQDVYKRLDPGGQDHDHKIGRNIKTIEEAKTQLDTAKSQLGTQVDSLNKWISTAEGIRKAAEDKAKEAYDKLKVNKTLDLNVKKIVDANERIKGVHTQLSGVHGSLGAWKGKAHEVLTGAIGKATEVHDALDIDGKGKSMPLGEKIKNIGDNNKLIQTANEQLGNHVKSLGDWKSAAKEVIDKAEGKCEDILKKVKTDEKAKEAVIYTQAQTLQDQGKRLFNAATDAKKAVEDNVNKALKAVVEMDRDLKKDLRNVKDKIKEGIKGVIETLKVNDLDTLVKGDLQSLKQKIEKLSTNVETSKAGSGLVGTQLQTLASKKTELDNGAVKSIQNAENGLGQKFTDHIQSALNEKVRAVYTAIGKLGGKFKDSGGKDLKTFGEIFGHIKKQVGDIKGTSGDPKAGLDGIAAGLINSYADGFKRFEGIVTGWAEGILGNNMPGHDTKAPTQWLGQYIEERTSGSRSGVAVSERFPELFQVREGIKEAIKNELQNQIDKGKAEVNISTGKINETIRSVKQGCMTFARELDNRLKEGIGNLAEQVFKGISKGINSGKDKEIKLVTEATLLGLSATTSQVANEIESILLGDYRIEKGSKRSIASELDRVVDETRTLHDQLEGATDSSSPGQNESPAQAVDSAFDKTKNFVRDKGPDAAENITYKFNNEVTAQLTAAVQDLPTAVRNFNKTAEAQIKAAAQTAIKEAANIISKTDKVEFEKGGIMPQFYDTFTPIKDGLQKQFEQQVDTHIGGDDPQSGVNIKDSGQFKDYERHITQPVKLTLTGEKNSDEGKLPLAIGNIKNQGLAALEKTIGNNGSGPIKEATFTGPFNTIKTELDEVKKLVDEESDDDDKKGIQILLKKLKDALNTGQFGTSDKGLEAIKTAIEQLKTGKYDKSSSEIDSAVTAIRRELEGLREKLKSGRKDDVIERLEHMKKEGFGEQEDWTPNGAKLSGLGKIHGDLETQNDILPEQTKIIEKAIADIKWELIKLGADLDYPFTPDDILDNLRRLENKIGKNGSNDNNNLQLIYYVIKKVQEKQFTDNPRDIGFASIEITRELQSLQGVLDGEKGKDIITTLEDLKGDGLSGQEWNTNAAGKKKSLQNIESALKTQQQTLVQQPNNIDQGVQEITQSLGSLRDTLEKDVTDKLQKLKSKGLTDKD